MRLPESVNRPKPLEPTIKDHGVFIEHNMPCPVCVTFHAVYVTSIGAFAPCWNCQDEGWRLKRSPKRPWWAFWR